MQNNTAPRSTVGIVDGDNILVRQSWLNQYILLSIVAALEVAIVYWTIAFPETATFTLNLGPLSFSPSYLPAIPLLVLARAAFNVHNQRLVITPAYLIHVSGRLWWTERSSRLEYSHIQEIETIQSIPQRLLGIADLNILPMGGGNRQAIRMKGLRNPRAVKDVIRDKRAQQPEIHNDAQTRSVGDVP